ncbi:MAG: tetratricopeptide repeat protein [Promethearchaeota archaeon]
MVYASVWQISLDKALDLLEKGENILNKYNEETSNVIRQKQASINYIKSFYYFFKSDSDQAIRNAERSLSVREELGSKAEIAESLTSLGLIHTLLKYEYDIAKEYTERSQQLAEETKQKHIMAYNFMLFGMINAFKGEIELGLMNYKQSLTMSRELKNKRQISTLYNNIGGIYQQKGEIEQALEYLKKALTIAEEIRNKWNIGSALSSIICLYVEKKDQDNAQKYFEMLKQFNEQNRFKWSQSYTRLCEALVLKMSTRIQKLAKAQELLEVIIDEEIILGEVTFTALINLCDLLLFELRILNNPEVIEELKPLINKLLNIAETTESHLLLTETYLLKSKLSLITIDITEAQRFLMQAKQISIRFDLNKLTKKIENEHDELLNKLELWERLKEENAPMAERIELSRMDEQIGNMFQNRAILAAQVSEEKVSIHKEKKVCLICRGEVLKYSYICECGAIYCGNCARAITDLENVCWACNASIDELKPSTPYKEEKKQKVEEQEKKHKEV